MHKMVVGLVLTFWKGCGYKDQLVPPLMTALTEEGSYEDLMPFLLAMQKDCHVRSYLPYSGKFWRNGPQIVLVNF